MTILQGNKRFFEFQFKLEDDFEELIREQSKTLFGKDAITDHERGKMLNYLRIAKLRVGLILNIINPRLEFERVVL